MHRSRDMMTYWSKIAEKPTLPSFGMFHLWGDPLRIFRRLIPWVAYAGDRGSNLASRTILVVFFRFLFSLDVRSSLYSAYSVILNHLDFDSRLFVFSTAKLSLHFAVHALMLFTVYGM